MSRKSSLLLRGALNTLDEEQREYETSSNDKEKSFTSGTPIRIESLHRQAMTYSDSLSFSSDRSDGSFDRSLRLSQEWLYEKLSQTMRQIQRLMSLGWRISKIVFREIINDIVIFSNILQTSKGRDKVFSLVQYVVQLYEKCMESSSIYKHLVESDLIQSVVLAKLVRQKISSARSVFKFLKFID